MQNEALSSEAFDEEGYLQDYRAWDLGLAETMAGADGIVLTEPHWEIIGFLRSYYAEYSTAPAIRALTRILRKRYGPDMGNSEYLFSLFPEGPAKQACRYAGLPKPTGCI